jgi:peptidoglycan/xylan/chitin deacetylase (PgdA/CDA1 family)
VTLRVLRLLTAAMMLLVVAALPVDRGADADSSAAVPSRPDARIRLAGGSNVGNDVYGTAANQTVSTFVRLGGTATFVVSAQNDGTEPDRLTVRSSGSTNAAWVVYLDAAGRDVTAAVAAGTFRTPTLAPGGRYAVRAIILPTGANKVQQRVFTVGSVARPDIRDRVRLVTSTNVLTTTPSVAYWSLPTTEKVVALTFDAGSDVGFTNQIIDMLADRRVQASFGITGEFAREHPDQIRRIAREGHEVMNHSDSHWSFTGASSDKVLRTRAERQADLREAESTLTSLIGHATIPYWRPPFGDQDSGVLADAGALGYSATVMWTIDTLGWKGLSVDAILDRVFTQVRPGAIILMHVGSQSQDGPALARMIDGLRARGYRFTTVFNGLPH